jgi:DNA-binding Xre family transcriptional regulator
MARLVNLYRIDGRLFFTAREAAQAVGCTEQTMHTLRIGEGRVIKGHTCEVLDYAHPDGRVHHG